MFARSGRAEIAYDSTGPQAGAGVLLLHAGVTDRRSWRSVVQRLSPGHRCVALDARGYGETRYEPEAGWSPVDDALAVLDAAGLERPVIVACSMGGQAALDLALGHPERVSGLVLIGSAIRGAPYPDVAEGPEAELTRALDAAEQAEDVDEVNRLEAWMWLDGPTAPEGRVRGEPRDLFLEMNGRALRAPDPGEQGQPPDAWPRLGEIAVPTLMLIGRLDVADIQAIDELAAAAITGARLRWLDGVAHLPQLEADPATLNAIAAFVAELDQG